MKREEIELLAPAGSYEGFEAAIGAGADAVYVGGAAFGARAYAKNFGEEELLRAIDTAHLHGKKLYLTVNTLLKNRELTEQLYDYLLPYYKEGLDAVIVQDMGVFAAIRELFPGMHLHASTQMTVTGPAGMKFLEEQGASRVVTARELSLEEIRRMHETSPIEIESFVHGALCYSYSGQCLMSSILGGRSGNRGRCAQPCRLPYKTALCGIETADIDERKENTDNKVAGRRKEGRKDENRAAGNRRRGSQKTENERYGNGKQRADRNRKGTGSDSQIAEVCPLSLKDISTIEILPEILNAGVTSLKIEGRMKQPGYTAGVTSVYRKYLDLLFEKGEENYRVEEADKRYLLDLFNRGGSCNGYYQMQNGPSMMAFSNEKKTGDVTPVLRKKKEKIQGILILFPGSPAILDVSCRGVHASASVGEVQFAQNQPLTQERVRTQMEKLGNTDYEWESLEIQMDESIFIPMKTLNEVRRQALEALEEEILKPYRREEAKEKRAEEKKIEEKEAAEKTAESEAKRALKPHASDCGSRKNLPVSVSCEDKQTALSLYKREGIKRMYLPFDAMEACLEGGLDRGVEMYLSLPHIMRGEMPEKFLSTAREWLGRGMKGFLVRNLESFAVLREAGLADRCVLDHSMYTWNDKAAAFWREQKVSGNTVPLELNEGEIRHRDNRDSEMLIYGYLPLMISAQCVRKNVYGCNHKEEWVALKDRYDKRFPAVCVCNPWKMENTDPQMPCYNIIYNSIPYGLLKERVQTENLGLSGLRLAFTIEKPEEAVKIFEEFKSVYEDGQNPPKRDYTRGHFKRGAE